MLGARPWTRRSRTCRTLRRADKSSGCRPRSRGQPITVARARMRQPHCAPESGGRPWQDSLNDPLIFQDWHGRKRSLIWPGDGPGQKAGGGSLCPRPVAPDRGLLLVAEAAAASPVVEEHEEHDQVDNRRGGQIDGQPLLPLAAVSGFCLGHCPPPSFVSGRFTGITYGRLRGSWKLAKSWL